MSKSPRFLFGAVVAVVLSPVLCFAQSAYVDVTLRVPLNMTNLQGDIAKLAVVCRVGAYQGAAEVAVSGRQVVTTVDVIVAIPTASLPPDVVGQTWQYSCSLNPYRIGIGWGTFPPPGQAGFADSRIYPYPESIRGNITW